MWVCTRVWVCVCVCDFFIFTDPLCLGVGGAMLPAQLSGEGGMHAILPLQDLSAWKQSLSTSRAHALDDWV